MTFTKSLAFVKPLASGGVTFLALGRDVQTQRSFLFLVLWVSPDHCNRPAAACSLFSFAPSRLLLAPRPLSCASLATPPRGAVSVCPPPPTMSRDALALAEHTPGGVAPSADSNGSTSTLSAGLPSKHGSLRQLAKCLLSRSRGCCCGSGCGSCGDSAFDDSDARRTDGRRRFCAVAETLTE